MTTNPDGTTKTASYGGCGCAGGEVVTLTDEGTIDPADGQSKRRQQKIYHDVLGRVTKTEVYNWAGGSIYSTTVNTYNVRDQLTCSCRSGSDWMSMPPTPSSFAVSSFEPASAPATT